MLPLKLLSSLCSPSSQHYLRVRHICEDPLSSSAVDSLQDILTPTPFHPPLSKGSVASPQPQCFVLRKRCLSSNFGEADVN